AWLADRDVGTVAEREAARALAGRAPDLRGQLAQVLALDEVDADTVVTARPGARVRVQVDDDRLVLALPDREVLLPLGVRPALDALLGSDHVRVGDLPGLDAPSQVVLGRRLVREGVLAVVPEGGAADA